MKKTADLGARSGVAQLYDRWSSYQWTRLDAFPCELHIHLETLVDHLPPGSRVLDAGCGPGRYAIELARRGHRVVAGDLSPVQVELARHHAAEAGFSPADALAQGGAIEAIVELDALDLAAFADASFDAVVAFGPFYHLQEEEERRRAAAEAARVVKPGGRIFAAFMPRAYWLSLSLQSFVATPGAPLAWLDGLARFYRDGRFEKIRSAQLREGYFCQVEEIAPLWRDAGVRQLRLLASNGVVAPWSRPETFGGLAAGDPEIRKCFLELVRATAADPHLLAMSDQILFVGERAAEQVGDQE